MARFSLRVREKSMAELQIKPGTKLQMAFDAPVGKQANFDMMATFKKAADDAFFLISVPVLDGRPLDLDINQKFHLRYTVGADTFIIAAYPEAVEKAGIRTLWKMRKVAEERVFFQRRDERFKISMHLTYTRETSHGTAAPEEAMTADVSAGGMALMLNDYPDVGEGLGIQLPPVTVDGQTHTAADQLGIVCWVREAPKGSTFRNVCGIQLRFADDPEREAFCDYIDHLRTKYKL